MTPRNAPSTRRLATVHDVIRLVGIACLFVAQAAMAAWTVADFETSNTYFPTRFEGWCTGWGNDATGKPSIERTATALVAPSRLGTTGNSVHFSYAIDGSDYPGAAVAIWTPERWDVSLIDDTVSFVMKGNRPSLITSVRTILISSFGIGDTAYDSASNQGIDLGFQVESLVDATTRRIRIPADSMLLPKWLSEDGKTLIDGSWITPIQRAYGAWVLRNRDSILAHITGVRIAVSGGKSIRKSPGSTDSLEIDSLAFSNALPASLEFRKPILDMRVAPGASRKSVMLREYFGRAMAFSARLVGGDLLRVQPTIVADSLVLQTATIEGAADTVLVQATNGVDSLVDTFVVAAGDIKIVGAIPNPRYGEDSSGIPAIEIGGVFQEAKGRTLAFYAVSGDSAKIKGTVSGSMLQLILARDSSGTVPVSVFAHNGIDTVSTSFNVAILPRNDKPMVVVPLADISIPEDTSSNINIDVSKVFMDIDGDVLTYSVVSKDPTKIRYPNISGSRIYFRPERDSNGIDTLIVSASDKLTTVSDTFVVTIRPINDAPKVDRAIGDGNVKSNAPWVLNLNRFFRDIDGDRMSFEFIPGEGSAELIVHGLRDSLLTIAPFDELSIGSVAKFTVKATDPSGSFATSAVASAFIVEPSNDTPSVVRAMPELTLVEDTVIAPISILGLFYDPNLNDRLHYSVRSTDTNQVKASIENRATDTLLVLQLVKNAEMGTVIYLKATDEFGAADSIWFRVSVTRVNDTPVVIKKLPDIEIFAGQSIARIALDSHFVDAEGMLEFQASYLAGAGLVTGIPYPRDPWLELDVVEGVSGTDTIIVVARDRYGLSVADTFTVTLLPGQRPTLKSRFVDLKTKEDSALTVQLAGHFEDPNRGDKLVYGARSLGGKLEATISYDFGSNDTLLLVHPRPNVYGLDSVEVYARDLSGNQIKDTFQVVIDPVNDAPVLVQAFQAIAAAEDSGISRIGLGSRFADVEDDEIEFEVREANPDLLVSQIVLDDQNQWLELTVRKDANGKDTLLIVAKDSNGDSTIAKLVVEVAARNDAPEALTNMVALIVSEDSALASIDLKKFFKDIDGDALAYGVTGANPSLLTTKRNGDSLELQLLENAFGSSTLFVTATDPSGKSDTLQYLIEVDPVNDAPIALVPTTSVRVSEDTTIASIDLRRLFRDVESGALSFDVRSSNSSLLGSKIESDSMLAIVLTPNAHGMDTLIVTATDPEKSSVSAKWILEVASVNDLPVARDTSASLAANGALEMLLSGSDIDGTIVSAVLFGQPMNGTAEIRERKLFYSPKAGYVGRDSLMFQVRDDEGGLSTERKVSLLIEGTSALRARTVVRTNHAIGIRPRVVLPGVAIGRGRGEIGTDRFVCQDQSRCESIELMLPQAAEVEIEVYDNLGAPVIRWSRFLDRGALSGLEQAQDGRRIATVFWNLRSSNGVPVAPGVYVWKIRVVALDGTVSETYHRLGVKGERR